MEGTYCQQNTIQKSILSPEPRKENIQLSGPQFILAKTLLYQTINNPQTVLQCALYTIKAISNQRNTNTSGQFSQAQITKIEREAVKLIDHIRKQNYYILSAKGYIKSNRITNPQNQSAFNRRITFFAQKILESIRKLRQNKVGQYPQFQRFLAIPEQQKDKGRKIKPKKLKKSYSLQQLKDLLTSVAKQPTLKEILSREHLQYQIQNSNIKYFCLRESYKIMLPYFIKLANNEISQQQFQKITIGNEKMVQGYTNKMFPIDKMKQNEKNKIGWQQFYQSNFNNNNQMGEMDPTANNHTDFGQGTTIEPTANIQADCQTDLGQGTQMEPEANNQTDLHTDLQRDLRTDLVQSTEMQPEIFNQTYMEQSEIKPVIYEQQTRLEQKKNDLQDSILQQYDVFGGNFFFYMGSTHLTSAEKQI